MAIFKNLKRIVIKIGTSTLTHETGRTNIRRMSSLVRVFSDFKNSGLEVIIVSSGAIAVGAGRLGLDGYPESTKERQAAAAVGQTELMFMYDKLFGEYGHPVGQILLNRSDVEDPVRKENLINTFEQLLKYKTVPIVNENDSIAVEELVFGDNDNLSAIVAKLVEADALIIITDIDGLYENDPKIYPDARIIPEVSEITDKIREIAGGRGSTRGTGGMITKIAAADLAVSSGISTIILNGDSPSNLYKILDGRQVGTMFTAKK